MSFVLRIAQGRSGHPLAHFTRQEIERQIDVLIHALDASDADPDFEPSIGWSSNNGGGVSDGQRLSPSDDREDDAGDGAEVDDDREWSLGCDGDLEADAGDEPEMVDHFPERVPA